MVSGMEMPDDGRSPRIGFFFLSSLEALRWSGSG